MRAGKGCELVKCDLRQKVSCQFLITSQIDEFTSRVGKSYICE